MKYPTLVWRDFQFPKGLPHLFINIKCGFILANQLAFTVALRTPVKNNGAARKSSQQPEDEEANYLFASRTIETPLISRSCRTPSLCPPSSARNNVRVCRISHQQLKSTARWIRREERAGRHYVEHLADIAVLGGRLLYLDGTTLDILSVTNWTPGLPRDNTTWKLQYTENVSHSIALLLNIARNQYKTFK